MRTLIERAPLDQIEPLREFHRQELACQIVHDSLPARGLADVYAIRIEGALAGYGCVGSSDGAARDQVIEFYLLAEHRAFALPSFEKFVTASGASRVRAQTNDPLLSNLLFDTASGIEAESVLFRHDTTTDLPNPGGTVRRTLPEDRPRIFAHTLEPVGDWLLEVEGEVVATAGTFHHYNPPFADLYMETAEAHRRRGYASYLLQEVKRVASQNGHQPAARCRVDNLASRAALQKAGMLPCGHILSGVLKRAAPGNRTPWQSEGSIIE